MSIFSNLFKKKPTEETTPTEELTELPAEQNDQTQTKVMIDKIESLSDSDRIIKKVRSGNIVIARIKELREQNMEELKHSISKIRTSVTMFNGDIAGVGDEWLVVTPSTARIQRASA
jgi:SepF-like predicted cell division protein (DUF552 family)